jgi:electron transport complex protein RnfG
MIVVLTIIATVMGSILSITEGNLRASIEYSKLKFVKGPAVLAVLTGYENDPVKDVIKGVMLEEKEGSKITKSIFVAKKNGKTFAVAFELIGKGYNGKIGVMIGIDIKTGQLTGMRLTTHVETPGLGSKATEPTFYDQFSGLEPEDVDLSAEGGKIDAISGATNTSIGVVGAVKEGLELFSRTKDNIMSAIGPV